MSYDNTRGFHELYFSLISGQMPQLGQILSQTGMRGKTKQKQTKKNPSNQLAFPKG